MPESVRSDTTGVPWYRRAGVWVGIGTGPGALSVGGGLAAQLSLPTLLVAVPVGALLLTALAVAQGAVSRQRREPLAQRASSTFGAGLGAGLVNLAILLGMIGWASFYVGIAGFSLATLLSLPSWAGAFLVVLALWALNELGLDRWNLLVWITTFSALGAAIFALVIMGARPTSGGEAGVSLREFLWGTGSVVTYGIVFAARAGDFTWDLEADSDVYKAGLALLVPLLIFLGIGAGLYQMVGDWNLADILAQHQSAGLGHLFLILSIIAPALSGLHSGALALESLASLNSRQSAGLICSASFVLGATRFDRWLLSFLDVLGAAIPPALVIMLLTAVLADKPRRSTALAAWTAGAVVSVILKLQGQLAHMVVGAGVSIAVLLIGVILTNRTQVTEILLTPSDQHEETSSNL